ncbi:MAG: hypothetical protein INR73_17975 [Williamsia sp.]|nr:hypothetical protein [Williamsia sp.]
MKLLEFYFFTYYIFFISKEKNEKWAITRALNLVLINSFFAFLTILVLVEKILPGLREKVSFMCNYNEWLSYIIVGTFIFGIHYILSKKLAFLVKSLKKETLFVKKADNLIAFGTIPLLVVIFIGVMRFF